MTVGPHIYLDYNATTPLHPEVKRFVEGALVNFGNPSSVHWFGREAKKAMGQTRERLARFINCDPLEIVFTSGGSEANNLALKGYLFGLRSTRREIITSQVEHPSVLKTLDYFKRYGYVVHTVPVNRKGEFDLARYKSLLSSNTALVSIQYVNNETGNVFPIAEITKLAHDVGAVVHSDMVQALGKIPVDLKSTGVDLASFAGHKIYALKGSGALFVKRGIHLDSLIHGGGQERNRRAGTVNALAIGSLGAALEFVPTELTEQSQRLSHLRDSLESRILNEIPRSSLNGGGAQRVANTLNISFDGVDGETLLINLDTRGFAVSSGAACSSGSQEPSPILIAMGLSRVEASQSLRISLGWLTTAAEIELFFQALKEAVAQMRAAFEDTESVVLESSL